MIKPEDIIQAEFSRSFLGYDMKEVDTLLDAVIEQMEAWEKERSEMLTALEYLLQEIEQHEKKESDTPIKQLGEREKAARIAQEKTEALTEGAFVSAFREEQEKKRSRRTSDAKPQYLEQPLPQAVAEPLPEQPQQIPLAKAHTESEAEGSFEIPTYVFAGTSGEAEEPIANETIKETIVAEEIELAAEAARQTSDHFSRNAEEIGPLSVEQEA